MTVDRAARATAGASARATFTIAVTPVNDPPRFRAGADQTVREDAGPQAVAGWAQAIAAGPADEAGQAVSLSATTTNPSLFAAGGQPAVRRRWDAHVHARARCRGSGDCQRDRP